KQDIERRISDGELRGGIEPERKRASLAVDSVVARDLESGVVCRDGFVVVNRMSIQRGPERLRDRDRPFVLIGSCSWRIGEVLDADPMPPIPASWAMERPCLLG